MIIVDTQDKMLQIAANWILDHEKQIIEIGCNTGNFASLLKERKISNYVGIDIQKEKIVLAKIYHPGFRFMCADIAENAHLLRKASLVVSFQTFEHIEDDLKVLNNISPYCKVILSVPNSEYKGHVRWFELEGWKERFEKFIKFNKIITIQNPRKPDRRSFLFKGVRNDYIDKETIFIEEHYNFDNMMQRVRRVTE